MRNNKKRKILIWLLIVLFILMVLYIYPVPSLFGLIIAGFLFYFFVKFFVLKKMKGGIEMIENVTYPEQREAEEIRRAVIGFDSDTGNGDEIEPTRSENGREEKRDLGINTGTEDSSLRRTESSTPIGDSETGGHQESEESRNISLSADKLSKPNKRKFRWN